MNKKSETNKRAGMTLMELLVVIAVLGVLMGLLMPGLSAARYTAQKAKVRSEVKQLEVAWKAYYQDYRSLPSRTEMDASAVDELAGNNPRKIVYMEFDDDAIANGFKDKWEHVYKLGLDDGGTGEVQGNTGTVARAVAVWSVGRDGQPGTDDDITSWK